MNSSRRSKFGRRVLQIYQFSKCRGNASPFSHCNSGGNGWVESFHWSSWRQCWILSTSSPDFKTLFLFLGVKKKVVVIPLLPNTLSEPVDSVRALAELVTVSSFDVCKWLRVFQGNIITWGKGKGRAHAEPDGTRWGRGGEVKGKLANGVGSQYSHATSERGLSSITKADAHTAAASSRLNWRPHRFKWTRPFRGETKSGFCACAITFRTSYTAFPLQTRCGG